MRLTFINKTPKISEMFHNRKEHIFLSITFWIRNNLKIFREIISNHNCLGTMNNFHKIETG